MLKHTYSLIGLVITLASVALIAACGKKEPVYQQYVEGQPQVIQQAPIAQPAPVVIQQAPAQQESSIMPALVGGALGYMAGRATAPQQQVAPSPQIIERRTVIVRDRTPATAAPVTPVRPTAAAAPSATTAAKPALPTYVPPRAAPAPAPARAVLPAYVAPARTSTTTTSTKSSSSTTTRR